MADEKTLNLVVLPLCDWCRDGAGGENGMGGTASCLRSKWIEMKKKRKIIYQHGVTCTVDEEIAELERLVESGRVTRIVTVAVEPVGDGLCKTHVMPCGTQLGEAHEILSNAADQVAEMIGLKR